MPERIIPPDDHIVTLNEAVRVAGVSLCTLRRLPATARGPHRAAKPASGRRTCPRFESLARCPHLARTRA
jgi:hypothetical protein